MKFLTLRFCVSASYILFILLTLLLPLLVSPLHADTIISADTTQDGGTLPVDPPILSVTSDSTTPVLTLTHSATASFTGAMVIGGLSNESGSLRILDGSTMTIVGDGTPIRRYGSQDIYYGDGILGLNADTQGTALISGTDSSWTLKYLTVGSMGIGSLTIEAGGQVSNSGGTLGAADTGQGTILVSGAGSQWINNSFQAIGFAGTGILHIEAGGSASSELTELGFLADSLGNVVVTDSGSQWTTANLIVGNQGEGHLKIKNAGLVSSVDSTLAAANGSQGEVVVTGSNSQWIMSGDLTLGVDGGTANLSIENGGYVENQFAIVGNTGQGEVTVTGGDSTWEIQENLTVGKQSNGTLHVTDSGSISSKNVHIGSESGSTGFVEITGSDSKWTGESISVGYSGQGELRIENGGRVSNTYSYIGRATGGQGNAVVSGSGSLWEISNNLTIGGTDSTKGELIVEDGGAVTVDGATILYSNGNLSVGVGPGLTTDHIENAGEILLSGGTLTVANSVLIQSGGSIGTAGIFDSLVDGELILASGASIQFSLTSTLNVSGLVTLDHSFGVASLIGLDQSTPIGSYTILGEVVGGTHTDYAALGIQNWGIENAYDLGGGKAAYFRQGSLVLEVVPEPSTVVLLLLVGSATILLIGRRKKH